MMLIFVFLNPINKNSRGKNHTSRGNGLVTTCLYQSGDHDGCLFIESDTSKGH